jgi:Tfp pilus assembly ATPase PilU
VRQRGDEVTPPREPLRLPPNFRDVTAEKIGTVIGIVGAAGAGKGAPKQPMPN